MQQVGQDGCHFIDMLQTSLITDRENQQFLTDS